MLIHKSRSRFAIKRPARSQSSKNVEFEINGKNAICARGSADSTDTGIAPTNRTHSQISVFHRRLFPDINTLGMAVGLLVELFIDPPMRRVAAFCESIPFASRKFPDPRC